ncbi:SGNH/GDSL hydrolase family protein [Paeniglutamicibacter antarcticus]|uniref:SGNH/GDSL hydrolase family protein n=1 Tax=Arthrobacter terrae TaxID=2935737 RepID=A0A931CPC7_9MICC|nr:SGNH/GDSL hydrolase family protein [Arthrobacter terrae]MBG0739069.1 SGNH/GDSL hydrolase family protein [Arthrobacter terrae]
MNILRMMPKATDGEPVQPRPDWSQAQAGWPLASGRSVLKAVSAAGLAALVAVSAAGILTAAEGLLAARRLMPRGPVNILSPAELFGSGDGEDPITLALLGDSLAAGFGVGTPEETVGVLLANGLATAAGRPVKLQNFAVLGAESTDLPAQLGQMREAGIYPKVALIIIGGNDVMHLRRIDAALAALADTVRELRRLGCQVVVATCPDMGTVGPILQPLRFLAHWVSRMLATGQTIVVLRNGGRTVSLGDLVGPAFRMDPVLMFSTDRLHPSARGYAEATRVLLPSVIAAAGYGVEASGRVPHRIYNKSQRRPLAWFAFKASRGAGVEVSAVKAADGGSVAVRTRTAGRSSSRVRRLVRPFRPATA